LGEHSLDLCRKRIMEVFILIITPGVSGETIFTTMKIHGMD